MVSYGYHEGAVGTATAVDVHRKARPDFLKANLERELAQIDEWSGVLGGGEAKRFLLTLVNKAVLWWDDRDKVLSYYREGP